MKANYRNGVLNEMIKGTTNKNLKSLLKEQFDEMKQIISNSRILGRPYQKLARRYRFIKGRIKPYKSARVYVKKGIDRMEFFSIMNNRGISYVLLRWWENLPNIPEGEDMDILIRDEDRNRIDDLITFHNNGTGLKCDIYTITGSNYGSHKGIPYFQSNLAKELIRSRVYYRGAYVPSPIMHFASLAYHAVFHKGSQSGLSGFNLETEDLEHDYQKLLEAQVISLGLSLNLTVNGIYEWLTQQEFAPAEDTLSKLVEINPELAFLQKNLYSDIRGGELMIYVVREQLYQDGFLGDFTKFLEDQYAFDVLGVRVLKEKEKDTCTHHIRGGKWDKGPFRYSGGKPAVIVAAFDYHPSPLFDSEQKKQSRMTNRNNLRAKYEFREIINGSGFRKCNYNGIHSSDNEHDARFYISLLNEDFQKKILSKVDVRRQRYARSWPLVKVLSTGKNSKVELIKYGEVLAVKKTFRPGKERFFIRELLAHKELSKVEDFIPPLLEEGDGFLIVPFLHNVLNDQPDLEKQKIISSKGEEIVRVIYSMYKRGLTFINFAPENICITPEGRFYCTDFSFLQYYEHYPDAFEQAYEIEGIPKDFKGDTPEDLNLERSSFEDVWGSYLGMRNKELKKKVLV